MVCVTIVGTGDLAHGLAHLFHVNNAKEDVNTLFVTKPALRYCGGRTFHETNVPLIAMDDGLARADVVILAIPARALMRFMDVYHAVLDGKIVVDATNSNHRGEDLLCILSHSTTIKSVKAFHDIGAVEALLDKPMNKRKIPVKMCSRQADALAIIRAFAEDSLGLDVKVTPYRQFDQAAQSQNQLDEPWVAAIVMMMVLFASTETYAILRYNVYKGYEWSHLPIQVTNKAICWTSLNGFALSQMPGVLARLWNVLSDDNLRSKPGCLCRFLQLRKQLGLLSLWFLFVHILMSMLIFGPGYYDKFFIDPTSTKSKLTSLAENSMLFGILGASLYAILGVCSLPSVGFHMNHFQWQLVYGPVAWIALGFGTVHVLIMGVKGWTLQETWPAGMPPITMTSVLLPMLVLFLKLCQVVLVRLFDSCLISSTPTMSRTNRRRVLDLSNTNATGGPSVAAATSLSHSLNMRDDVEKSGRRVETMEMAESAREQHDRPKAKTTRKLGAESAQCRLNNEVLVDDTMTVVSDDHFAPDIYSHTTPL